MRSQSPEREHVGVARKGRRGRRTSPQPSPSRSPVRAYNRRNSPDGEDHGSSEEYHPGRSERSSNRSPPPGTL